jgi:hypothetical protein
MTVTRREITFAEQVTTYFGYLLAEQGFTVAYARENAQREYAEVLLESPDCYIKFSRKREDWDMQMAQHTETPEQAEWLAAGLIYNYVTQALVNIEESLKPQPVLSPEESLKQWADKFKPVSAQAVAFFNPEGYAERLAQFKTFVAEQNAEAKHQLQAWQAAHKG